MTEPSPPRPPLGPGAAPWQAYLYDVIFESESPQGRAFDILLLFLIIVSVVVVCLETVSAYSLLYGRWFRAIEWVITVSFTVEYFARIAVVNRPRKYIFSFFGVVDLLSMIPTYLSLFIDGSHYLSVVRALRLLRVFRVFKLTSYVAEGSVLAAALVASRQKIAVFMFTIINAVIVVGTIMYLVEGPEHGFTSIPVSIYWAIVTLTTVGYGDIAPKTQLGQIIASVVMILGYGIIAVPTGIVTVELSHMGRTGRKTQCRLCRREGHEGDACFCKYCGQELSQEAAPSRA